MESFVKSRVPRVGALLERRKAEKTRTQKSFKHLRENTNSGLWGHSSGPLVACLGGISGPSGGLWKRKAGILGSCSPQRGPSWAALGRLLARLGRPRWPSGGPLESSCGSQEVSDAVLGRSLGPFAPSREGLGRF